jgi:hypothetical protein
MTYTPNDRAKCNQVPPCLRVVAGHVKTRQAGCAQPITIPAETGLVRKGFRKLRHKLTLILPIGWRLILSDLNPKISWIPFPAIPSEATEYRSGRR